ncbi:MAG: selenide, water dikinase SelD [Parvularculaceae bacterium]
MRRAQVAQAAGAPIAGGTIESVEPIYGLVALGLVHPDRILKNSAAQAGDILILGKPLGIGVFSAALKKEMLSDKDYAAMIGSTTLLNRPGAELAAIAGVHAVTDVTGFGLCGHLAEMCRGAGLAARIDRKKIPVFDGARRLVAQGVRTGASPRNWASIEAMVDSPAGWSDAERDIFCDPQTSGGLLVSCAPEAGERVLQLFRSHGHAHAAIIGEMEAGPARIRLA